jgi:hypothetical protein
MTFNVVPFSPVSFRNGSDSHVSVNSFAGCFLDKRKNEDILNGIIGGSKGVAG